MAYGARKRVKAVPGPMTLLGQTYRLNAPGVPPGQKSEVINHFAVPDANRPDYLARCWDELHPGPPWLTGGPFSKIAVSTPWTQKGQIYHAFNTGSFQYHYEGGFCPLSDFGPGTVIGSNLSNIGLSGSFGESFLSAEPFGAKAYNSARPKPAQVGVDVFLGELKDLPKTVKTTAQGLKDLYGSLGGNPFTTAMSPKKVSDHYINHVFGWAPFVSDLFKIYEVYQNTDSILAKLVQQNGKWTHRYRVVHKANDLVLHPRTYQPMVQPILNGLLYARRNFEGKTNISGFTDYTSQDTDDVWFEGSFKYYLAPFDRGRKRDHDRFRRIMQLVTIYGLRISPATVWKLTPWSWLVDWATNAGDVLDNLVAAGYDNLVSRYAFVMRHRLRLNSMTAVVFLKNYGDTLDTWVQTMDTKDRRVATPYGFAVDMTSLSDRQKAILVALGISRIAA